MKVYTGTFRYCGDGDIEIVVATTVERIERELIRLMKEYVQWINSGDTDEIPTDFYALQQMGWDNEWYDVGWSYTDLLTDEHILKYAMETI
jgi:acylphosphatase